MTIEEIRTLLGRVSCELLGTEFTLLVEHDKKFRMYRGINPEKIGARIYLQVQYDAPCTKTGVHGTWKGGKYYLSSHMTPDEIVKKAYVAFEAAVKHEIMEGFKVDGKILFNPHVNFEELLKVSDREVQREEPKPEPTIFSIGLSSKVQNIFAQKGILTVSELKEYLRKKPLLTIRGIGRRAQFEVEQKLGWRDPISSTTRTLVAKRDGFQ